MYHYTESGLSNVYLKNGVTVEVVDGEEYTSIDDMNGLHSAIAQTIVNTNKPLAHDEFKFLRIELNVSQKMLANRFGVDEQTIARWLPYSKKGINLRSIRIEALVLGLLNRIT